MSRVLQYFPMCFQWLSFAIGNSTRHSRDMANRKGRKRILPADADYAAGVSNLLATVQERYDARLRDREKQYREIRDRGIVIHLKILRRGGWASCWPAFSYERNKMDRFLVPHVAKFFGVSTKTVWNAWRAMKHQSLQSLIDGTGLLLRL